MTHNRHLQYRERRSRRSRYVRSLLAAGLVLGVGGSLTLAKWQSREFAGSTFKAGAFQIQSATTGNFASHPTYPGLIITAGASELGPTNPSYIPFSVSTTPNTKAEAELTLIEHAIIMGSPAPGSDPFSLSGFLKYRLVKLASDSDACVSNAFAVASANWITPVNRLRVDPAQPLPATNPFRLAAGGANPQKLCLEISLDSTTPLEGQGQNAQVRLGFHGTSQ